jgi:hypothetical protein
MARRPAIVQTIDCAHAEDLLAHLSPARSELWTQGAVEAPGFAEWIFRGQGNGEDGARWSLTPSALRPRALDAYGGNGGDRRDDEQAAVMRFATMADRHGFVVPDDQPALRDSRIPRGRRGARTRRAGASPLEPAPSEFPRTALVGMFALAQHNGVPTRLLDWTWKPLVAAYFAAADVAKRRCPGRRPGAREAQFSVFALRRAVVEACRGLDPEVHILTVPTATNTNLHVQGGVFTLVQPTGDDGGALPDVDAVLRGHARAIAARDRRWRSYFPLLVELRVPPCEARTLLRLLALVGVSAASVYPSLAGVAEAVREERYHQWAPRRSRS